MSLSTGYIKADSSILPTVNQDMVTGFFLNNTQFISAEVKNVKTERSAKEEYGDNAIFHVQLKREGDTCTVRGQITPEHKVRQKPYDVVVVLKKDEIFSAQCLGCAASQGGCKHVVAFLLWLHRRSEEPSVTSTQCYWKGSNLSKCINIDLDLARLLKKPLRPLQENKSVVEHVLGMFPENQGSMFMLLQPRNNPSIHCLLVNFLENHKNNPSVEHFLTFAEAKITPSMIKDVECNTRSQYQSKQWFEMRFGRITASVIYEAAKCKTFNGSLTERILGASQPFETAATIRGKLLEVKVIQAVEIKKKIKISHPGLLLKKEHPIFGASPDGITSEYVIEVKCPSKDSTVKNYVEDGKIKNKFYYQIQLQMYFANKQKGLFCIAAPTFEANNEVEIIEVKFDNQSLEDILNCATTFWKEAIFKCLMASYS